MARWFPYLEFHNSWFRLIIVHFCCINAELFRLFMNPHDTSMILLAALTECLSSCRPSFLDMCTATMPTLIQRLHSQSRVSASTAATAPSTTWCMRSLVLLLSTVCRAMFVVVCMVCCSSWSPSLLLKFELDCFKLTQRCHS
ncbi:hypothetical protein PoB_005040500 [Plakobranchus ocellatus]|uniref:Secreted protein n=1 Tax=Plakobranchus ocellatus TaxID=259542 RepID=A0AAV4BX37_9GAST|nr:hypothetical protein PoB_005040500 [Plakobranchus ocellatus]